MFFIVGYVFGWLQYPAGHRQGLKKRWRDDRKCSEITHPRAPILAPDTATGAELYELQKAVLVVMLVQSLSVRSSHG